MGNNSAWLRILLLMIMVRVFMYSALFLNRVAISAKHTARYPEVSRDCNERKLKIVPTPLERQC